MPIILAKITSTRETTTHPQKAIDANRQTTTHPQKAINKIAGKVAKTTKKAPK